MMLEGVQSTPGCRTTALYGRHYTNTEWFPKNVSYPSELKEFLWKFTVEGLFWSIVLFGKAGKVSLCLDSISLQGH